MHCTVLHTEERERGGFACFWHAPAVQCAPHTRVCVSSSSLVASFFHFPLTHRTTTTRAIDFLNCDQAKEEGAKGGTVFHPLAIAKRLRQPPVCLPSTAVTMHHRLGSLQEGEREREEYNSITMR